MRGTQLLPRLIGKGAALYYLLTAENIPAQEAYRLGLVDKIVPADKLMVTALAIAKVIGQQGPIAARLIIEAVNKGLELSIDKGLELEEEQWRKCGATEDFNEAINLPSCSFIGIVTWTRLTPSIDHCIS